MNMKTKTFSNHGAFVGIAITSITIGHFLWTCGKRYLFFWQAQPYVNKDFIHKNAIMSHFLSHLKLDTLDALMCMSLFGIEVDNMD